MKGIQVFSFLSFGYEGKLVKVEADLKTGLPITEIVGLPGNAVKEARERVRAAVKNSELEYPPFRVLINLSPASERKEGSGFDLAIALAVLAANEKTETQSERAVMVIGELELSGRVRHVSGVLAAISCGIKAGIANFIVPKENKREALIPGNCRVFGAENLCEAFTALQSLYKIDLGKSTNTTGNTELLHKEKNQEAFQTKIFTEKSLKNKAITWSEKVKNNYGEVKGQDNLLFAVELAAAGGHNMLVYGTPGCGKTLALKKFADLLPDLDFKTSEELTRIYSIAGLLNVQRSNDILIRRPPFRMPHQSASLEGIIGGAGKCMPGEISLSHGGVLFLDEAAQFKPSVLQSLRAPLENGFVTLSRAEKRSTYPAQFQLLLAMNPCECGNLGSAEKFCTCSMQQLDRYWKKLTAPLLDRIDMRIFVEPPKAESLLAETSYSSESMRAKVKSVYEQSFERNGFYMHKKMHSFFNLKNAHISAEYIGKICILTDEAALSFNKLSNADNFSGRASHAVLKLARTIADIENLEKINTACLEQAAALRKFNPLLPDFL